MMNRSRTERPMRRWHTGVSLVLAAQLVATSAGAAPIDVEAVPVPSGATEVDRNSDIEMITYRSALEPNAVQEFYEAKLGEQGWKIDDEESWMVEEVGSLTFANGDDAFRIAVQDGRPTSRTRMIVMGEGVKWAKSDAYGFEDELGDPAYAEDTGPLAARDDLEYPVPADCESIASGGSPFRTSVEARIRRPLADVAEFYRRELPARGWGTTVREDEIPGERIELDVDGERGPLSLVLRKKRKDTVIEMSSRDTAAAREAGVLPEPGQSKLLLGNIAEVDAVITVDGEEKKVAAGTGAEDPSLALALALAPGAHEVKITSAGDGDQVESLDLGADETWAVMFIGDGAYFADRVY